MRVIGQDRLDEAARRIRTAVDAEEIRLFGSHAYGQPHRDSDIDLLVIVPTTGLSSYDLEVAAYRSLRGLKLPIELKVVTRDAFDRRATWLSSVERAAAEKGRVLDVR